MKNDSGSSLTHGTDIVFAGNVTSSLRRHRSESEPDAHIAALVEQLAAVTAEGSGPATSSANSGGILSPPLVERPKTPARMSITDTLDRAHELETQKHKSRDAIMNELKSWQQEGAISQLGVTHVASNRREKGGDSESPSSKVSSKRREPSSRTKTGERRPNTSAGVLRNGASVREAFVESSSGAKEGKHSSARAKRDDDPVRLKSPAPLHGRSSFSTSSSSNHVDILILDGSDERRPCSPTKSSKGIFTTGGGNREWNLDALSPKLDLSTAESSWRNFPQSGEATQLQNDRIFQKTPRKQYDDDNGDDSSSSDGGDTPDRARVTTRKAKLQPKVSQGSAAFFNVAESLHAIDRWRDDMDDDDDKKIVRVESYQHECLSPKAGGLATETASSCSSSTEHQSIAPSSPAVTLSPPKTQRSPASLNQTDRHHERPQQQHQPNPEQLGPANFETDAQVVRYMREKHKAVADTKTRDGFRRYFKGIEADRLERILQQVFADQEKVRRRLQLMTGFYRHEISS